MDISKKETAVLMQRWEKVEILIIYAVKQEIDGKVYAFDVQEDALRQTKEKLDKHEMNAKLILDGHEHMKKYVKESEVSCIMFNLGYLPGGTIILQRRQTQRLRQYKQGLSC